MDGNQDGMIGTEDVLLTLAAFGDSGLICPADPTVLNDPATTTPVPPTSPRSTARP